MKRFLSLSISVLMVLSLFVVPASAETAYTITVGGAAEYDADTNPDNYWIPGESYLTSGKTKPTDSLYSSGTTSATMAYATYQITIPEGEEGDYSLQVNATAFGSGCGLEITLDDKGIMSRAFEVTDTATKEVFCTLGLSAGVHKIKFTAQILTASSANVYFSSFTLTRTGEISNYSFALTDTVAYSTLGNYSNLASGNWAQFALPEGIAEGYYKIVAKTATTKSGTSRMDAYLSEGIIENPAYNSALGTLVARGSVIDTTTGSGYGSYSYRSLGIIKITSGMTHLSLKAATGDIRIPYFALCSQPQLTSDEEFSMLSVNYSATSGYMTSTSPTGGMGAGASVSYPISVAEPGIYKLTVETAQDTAGTLDVLVNDTLQTTAQIPAGTWDQGTWSTYSDVEAGYIKLQGEAVLTLRAGVTMQIGSFTLRRASLGELSYMQVNSSEFVNHTEGGSSTPGTALYNSNWVEYKIPVSAAGLYKVVATTHGNNDSAKLELLVNGVSQGAQPVPNAGWENGTERSDDIWYVSLEEGMAKLRFKASGAAIRFRSFTIETAIATSIVNGASETVTTVDGLTDETLTITGPADKTDCTMVAALYADGALVKAAIGAADGTVLKSTLSGVTTDATKDNELRVYYWNSLADMQPVAGYYTVK